MRRGFGRIASATLLAAVLATAACTASEPLEPAAAAAVQDALDVRASRSTDASDYAPYFADPTVAEALAESARLESTSTVPIPEWEPPYVSAETSASADVVVVWVPAAELPDWPRATVFSLEMDERWFIVDASDVTTGPIPSELVPEGD